MTANDFRRLALALPETAEHAHMDHPDFRVAGKIFATLGYPAKGWGMVKLTPQDQKHFVELHSRAFTPVKGAWGLQGCTNVRLDAAKPDVLAQALDLAWQNSAAAPAKKVKKSAARARPT